MIPQSPTPLTHIDWLGNSLACSRTLARVKSWSSFPGPGRNLHCSSWIQGPTISQTLAFTTHSVDKGLYSPPQLPDSLPESCRWRLLKKPSPNSSHFQAFASWAACHLVNQYPKHMTGSKQPGENQLNIYFIKGCVNPTSQDDVWITQHFFLLSVKKSRFFYFIL